VVNRVVAFPELIGPHIRGLPSAAYSFIPVDHLCRVPGTDDVYAAGDGTDYPVKHGGIAAQQAEVAARCIAAAAGIDVQPHPFHPTLSGMLLTGGRTHYPNARLIGGHPFGSAAARARRDGRRAGHGGRTVSDRPAQGGATVSPLENGFALVAVPLGAATLRRRTG
jgi:sulfide:quinone oxidoreductase